jgi:hypothetical protein
MDESRLTKVIYEGDLMVRPGRYQSGDEASGEELFLNNQ